jgi:hypothetical protein
MSDLTYSDDVNGSRALLSKTPNAIATWIEVAQLHQRGGTSRCYVFDHWLWVNRCVATACPCHGLNVLRFHDVVTFRVATAEMLHIQIAGYQLRGGVRVLRAGIVPTDDDVLPPYERCTLELLEGRDQRYIPMSELLEKR